MVTIECYEKYPFPLLRTDRQLETWLAQIHDHLPSSPWWRTIKLYRTDTEQRKRSLPGSLRVKDFVHWANYIVFLHTKEDFRIEVITDAQGKLFSVVPTLDCGDIDIARILEPGKLVQFGDVPQRTGTRQLRALYLMIDALNHQPSVS